MKHPCLRVASVLDVHVSFMDELEKLGRSIIEVIQMPALDLEWCGSYANGCAALHSDIDLALPAGGFTEQMELRRLLSDQIDVGNAVRKLVRDFGTKWGVVMMDFNPVVPDNKQTAEKFGWAVYSVFERKLYGRPADLINNYLELAPYTQRYQLKPYIHEKSGQPMSKRDPKMMPNPAKWARDEWADEVPKWRKIYGSKFLETKMVNGELMDASIR